jgi:hypothetical protein
MSLVLPQPPSNNNSLLSSTEVKDAEPSPVDTEAAIGTLLGAFTNAHKNHMDRGATEFSQTGLPTPYPHAFTEPQSEDSPADHASATHYTPQPEPRSNTYPASATPSSEFGAFPPPARSSSYPEHLQRYHPGSSHSGSSGGMAQPTSPSLPDGRHHNPQIKSDRDVAIDPSIASGSPTYPPTQQHGQYSPYPAQQEMQHGYPAHPAGAMYQQPRPDWAGYGGHPQQHGMPGYAVSGAQTPTSAAPAGARPGQVGLSPSLSCRISRASTLLALRDDYKMHLQRVGNDVKISPPNAPSGASIDAIRLHRLATR